MNLSRTSGVLLHPTSLPSGRLGPEAYAWVDWLAEAGQSWWQMLPLGPPDEHRSPHAARLALRARRGVRRRAGPAGEAVGAGARVRGAGLPRGPGRLDRGLAGVRRV